MKMTLLLSCFLLFASLSSFADKKMPADPKMQEMMKKMEEYATPGEFHKILASSAGKWTYTSKWWESADAKPMESVGTSTMKMVLSGRFLQHETNGKAIAPSEKPAENSVIVFLNCNPLSFLPSTSESKSFPEILACIMDARHENLGLLFHLYKIPNAGSFGAM